MSDNDEQPGPSGVRELENGIFNMTVTLVQHLQTEYPQKVAREYVATYLDRLSHELRQYEENNQEMT